MHKDFGASLTNWLELLPISTRLLFDAVRARAIEEITSRLDEVSPFDIIALAVKHDVTQWLKPAYQRIVTRNDPITQAEACKLPFHITIMLTRSRERYQGQLRQQEGYNCYNSGYNYGRNLPPSFTTDQIIDNEVTTMEQNSEGGGSTPIG
jgi:hypothetical protein